MKVLFYYSKLSLGGAELSNLRMMTRMVNEGWQVTCVLKSPGGELEKRLPSAIKVNHLDYRVLTDNSSDNVVLRMAKYFLRNSIRLIKMQAYRFYKYDIAINGLQGLSLYFIAKCVNAEVKFNWIRNDLKGCDTGGKVAININKYDKYVNYYPCVSTVTYNSFCKAFPRSKDKGLVFYNFLNKEEMITMAEAEKDVFSNYSKDVLKVVTVCRIQDKAKGVFRMLEVYKKLRENGIFFYWFVIGEGVDFCELHQRIHNHHLEDGFLLLGKRSNPYPYYKAADLCATLSYYEGLCGTVNEAKVLGKAVIATVFSGIDEQIEHGVNGYVVENEEKSVFEGMKKLLTDDNLRDKLTNTIYPKAILEDSEKINIFNQLLAGMK